MEERRPWRKDFRDAARDRNHLPRDARHLRLRVAPAPRRQYIVNLDGAVEITASDGEKRIIGPGEVFLVEDTHGKGHFSKAVEGKMRHSLFIPIE